jgi:hypothetical protein
MVTAQKNRPDYLVFNFDIVDLVGLTLLINAILFRLLLRFAYLDYAGDLSL